MRVNCGNYNVAILHRTKIHKEQKERKKEKRKKKRKKKKIEK